MTMNLITIDEQNAVIGFRAPVSEHSALAVQEMCSILINYYQHSRIILKINSPGGEINSLMHLVNCFAHYRRNGIQMITQGELSVASAAAVLLSMGEIGERQLNSTNTQLLFHDARTNGTGEQTQRISSEIASRLSCATMRLVETIARHVQQGLGDVENMAMEGIARCALLTESRNSLADALPSMNTHYPMRTHKAIEAMWQKCLRTSSGKPYIDLLSRRFEAGTQMDLREAYALNLIDGIAMVERLVPKARLEIPGAGCGTNVRLAA